MGDRSIIQAKRRIKIKCFNRQEREISIDL
jgi:hypothetical protein